jgi:hypothetical protein
MVDAFTLGMATTFLARCAGMRALKWPLLTSNNSINFRAIKNCTLNGDWWYALFIIGFMEKNFT